MFHKNIQQSILCVKNHTFMGGIGISPPPSPSTHTRPPSVTQLDAAGGCGDFHHPIVFLFVWGWKGRVYKAFTTLFRRIMISIIKLCSLLGNKNHKNQALFTLRGLWAEAGGLECCQHPSLKRGAHPMTNKFNFKLRTLQKKFFW